MRLPVFDVKSISEIKEVALYKEFQFEEVDTLMVLRYIAACYDKKSDLMTISKIEKRKAAAANMANFPKTTTGLVAPYDDVVTLSGKVGLQTGRAIITYCRLQNDSDLYQLFSYEETLIKQNELLLAATDPKDVGNIIGNINNLNKAIVEIRMRFLNNDDSDSTNEALLDYIMNETLNLSPEEIMLKDEVKLWGCYGERYKFKKYTIDDLSIMEFDALNKELTNDTEEAREQFTALSLDAEQIINDKKEQWKLKRKSS